MVILEQSFHIFFYPIFGRIQLSLKSTLTDSFPQQSIDIIKFALMSFLHRIVG